jgi:hypothetical protein
MSFALQDAERGRVLAVVNTPYLKTKGKVHRLTQEGLSSHKVQKSALGVPGRSFKAHRGTVQTSLRLPCS